MNTRENGPEIMKSMPCGSSDKTLAELKNEGWEESWSFHTRLTDQWNQACDKVVAMQSQGLEVLLVDDPGEAERRDGVAYLYTKAKPE